MKITEKLLVIVIIIISICLISNTDPVFATTKTNNYNNGSATGWNAHISAENFTGLPAGGTISQLSLNVSAVAGHVRAKIYQDDGYLPITNTFLHNFHATALSGLAGSIYLEKFSGLPHNNNITSITMDSTTNAGGLYRLKVFDDIGVEQHQVTIDKLNQGGATSGWKGNVRATQYTGLTAGGTVLQLCTQYISGGTLDVIYKIYDDSGGSPNNLLGETASNFISSAGLWCFSFPTTITVPSNGIVWGAFESDNNNSVMQASASGSQDVIVSHVFGTGPDPFGTASSGGATSIRMVLIYTDYNITGVAGNLIGEGFNGNPVVSGFINTVSTNIPIPADGVVWAGFEVGNNAVTMHDNVTSGGLTFTHSFGAGPSSTSPSTLTNSSFQVKFQIIYQNQTGPSTLLGESNSITINSTGIQNFPLTAIIPSSGKVWGAFETDSASLGLRELTKSVIGNIFNATHTYGAGPSPISLGSNSTHPAWMQISYSNPVATVSFRPLLHDGVTLLTSGTLLAIQNGVVISSANTNSTGWATLSSLTQGTYNFTVMDDKNFAVYKKYNTAISGNLAKSVTTYDTPFNCISGGYGYQANLLLRINDTDGTQITNITTPTCPNQNQVIFNMTFTGNGNTPNSFSSSMITTIGTQTYAANPSSFTVSGTTVPTTFTQGNNIVSNSFSIGSGLVTTTKQFIISLTTTQSTGSASQSGGQNYFTNNQQCFAGVYDPTTSSCVFGPVNVNIPQIVVTTDPNQQLNGNIAVSCDGTNSLTINSIDLGSNPLGIQLGQLPITINCNPNPTVCPTGTTLQNGQCIAQLQCPIGSQTQNGVCVGTVTCPAGTTQQGSQCIAQPTCADGSTPVNGQCMISAIPITVPPIPSTCNLSNPLSCIEQTTTTTPATVTGITDTGQVVSVKTSVTTVQNPELNNVSLVIIILIIAAVIAGVIYRYITRKPKGRIRTKSGKDKTIKEFNRSIRKN